MPFDPPEAGCYWIRWEVEAITYQKQLCFEVGEPFSFLWPFQSHGVYTFQILDADYNILEFTIDGVVYDCFNAIGIPVYEIPEEELDELIALCDDPFGLLDIEFVGRGDLEVLEWELDPPPGGDDWEIAHEFVGRGDLELVDIEVADPPDHELEAELIGRGDLDLEHVVLGDPPGFAYLLNEEDNVMQAFSFRKLRPAYTGYCCRIERWADNATLDVGFSGGWLDETAVNAFLMGTDGGIRIWYNQMGAGGDWEQSSALLQLQIGFSGGVVKKSIGAIPYIAAYGNVSRHFDTTSGSVGPWFGTSHSASLVVHTDGDTNPYHIYAPGLTQYAGRGNSFPTAHYALAGSPEYWANNVYQLSVNADAYRAYVVPNSCHVWMNALDLSLWTETSFGEGFNGYIFEYVLFNLNMTAQRVAKTALVMPVYNL